MKRGAGFTLVEILMVVAIFSIAVLLSVDVFLGATRAQRRVQSDQRVQADARFSLESITREARAASFDYPLYADLNEDGTSDTTGLTFDVVDLAQPATILALLDSDGNRTVYRRSSSDAGDPWRGDGDRLEMCTSNCQGAANWADITPTGEQLCDFRVLVNPVVDPFLLVGACSNDISIACTSSVDCGIDNTCLPGDYLTDIQPNATITFAVADERASCGTTDEQRYQLTVTSRVYVR